METIRLALSAKQHASLRKGRKVRLNAQHMTGSGVQYIVHPATYDRLTHSFSMRKGMDLALDPTEIQASMLGGGLTGNLRRASKVLHFIGDEIIQPVAKFIAPVAKPLVAAATNLGVTKINNMADPSARYLNVAERGVDFFNHLGHPQRTSWEQGPTTDAPAPQKSMIQLATVAALSNAFSPAPPAKDPVGTYYPTAEPVNKFRYGGSIHGYGAHFLTHRPGTFQAPGTPFHPLHAARVTASQFVGFKQQIPQVYKDAARLVSGSGMYL